MIDPPSSVDRSRRFRLAELLKLFTVVFDSHIRGHPQSNRLKMLRVFRNFDDSGVRHHEVIFDRFCWLPCFF